MPEEQKSELDDAGKFTWFQRGWLDCTTGVDFGASPAPDLFARNEWEKGWIAGHEYRHAREMRLVETTTKTVLTALSKRN